MAKEKSPPSFKKKFKKKLRKTFKPHNIGKFLIVAATVALLATSILPYLF